MGSGLVRTTEGEGNFGEIAERELRFERLWHALLSPFFSTVLFLPLPQD